MIAHRFRITNLRYRFFSALKRKAGVRNYRIICGIAIIVMLATIIAPITLSTNDEESFAVDVSNREKVVDVRFLNTQTDPSLDSTSNSDEANLIKTKDNKYVLIDTATNNEKKLNIIYQALKNYQGSNSVTIDYLVISHMHSDHYGNAVNIINHNNITVKNLIIKYGKSSVGHYDDIISAAKKKNITIYTNAATRKVDGAEIQTYSKYKKLNTEGTGNAVISVGSYLKLYFYNTVNVYDNCTNGYALNWFLASKDEKSITKDSKGRYLRFDNTGGSYPNIEYAYANTLEDVSGFRGYYYAGFSGEKNDEYKQISSCNDNANSYGVLAEVTAGSGKKYIYFANDLDNSGYDIKPTTTNVTYYSTTKGKNVTKTQAVYGQGRNVLYAQPDLKLVKNGTTVSKNVAYSESKVALEIADKLGSGLSNLVIYQQSHHGIDNAPDAIATLNLNRSSVYAIVNRKQAVTSGYTKYSFDYQRSSYYLSETKKKLHTGYKEGSGVYCAIDSVGDYLCSYKEIGTGKLSYNMNGGSGSIAAQTCLHDTSCSFTISSTVPTRSGFKFLGWATSSNAKSAAYVANTTITVPSNTTLYAVWTPNRTLSYDMNGGSDSVTAQVCNATTTTGNCTVKVSSTVPTRSGYRFVGWSESNSATNASYVANDSITLNSNKTIYAVWQRIVNINTSVDGSNGTITPSMTNVPKGRPVTIIFSPYYGYEIDNVKVNGTLTAITDNTLSITTGDEDINIVVKYKLSPSVDPEPSIITQVFHMYFGKSNGETGTPSTQNCTAIAEHDEDLECNIDIPETTPTRNNYVFLGYGTVADRNTVVYHPGETYALSDDVYVVSVWAPIYTLNYDANDGMGAVPAQTCYPAERANDNCSVVIDMSRPTMENHEFFGWATDPTAEIPEYLPGDTFVFSVGIREVTLYAVWAEGTIEWIQNQDYNKGSGSDLIVEIEYPMKNFVSLVIDDNIIDQANYTVTSGSTIIVLDDEYVDTLEAGGHIMIANYNDGVTATTTFTVQEEGEEDSGGDDGDDEDHNDYMDEDQNQDVDEPDTDDEGLAVPNTGASEKGENGSFSIWISAGAIVILTMSVMILKRKHAASKIGFKKKKY